MNVLPLVPEKAKRDGCECPEFHERCCHYAGQAIYLAPARRLPGQWNVTQGKDGGERAWTGAPFVHTVHLLTHDYEAALAAFHAAEERLLAGPS